MKTRRRLSATVQSPLETYLREINETPLLSPDDEHQLAISIGNGNVEARDRMVRANLRLVVNIARGYTGKGLGLQDLIEEGNLGLIKAVERFDISHNCRFSTYATWWIRQFINRSITNQGSLVRVPSHKRETLYRAKLLSREFSQEMGRDPQPWELLVRLEKEIPSEEAQEIVDLFYSPAIVEPLIGTDDNHDHALRFEDSMTPRPDYEISLISRDQRIFELVKRLGEREQFIVTRRFGLTGEDPSSLQEIADQLGLTRERVRQLQHQALAAIREMIAQSGEQFDFFEE